MALPLKQRLRLASDFRSVARSKKGFKEGRLLLYAKMSDREVSRFGIVISKAVSKKAVERNRMKRLLLQAIWVNQKSLKISSDIVLIALPGFSLQDLKEATGYIEKLFLKAKLATFS